MKNKLSYYSVILLIGLAVASGLILVSNPFNKAPASASPGATTPAVANTASTSTNSTSTASGAVAPPAPTLNGFGDDSQPGGTADGDHDHHVDSSGTGGSTGNSTTTTTTSIYYSQNA